MLLVKHFKTLRSILLLGTLLATMTLIACQRQLTPQTSCNFLQNPDQQRVSWKGSLPIALHVHSSVPSSAYSAIEESINVYEEAFGQKVFEIIERDSQGPLTPKRDGQSVIYWMPTWESERLNEQGRTTVYWSGNHIYEADIRINASTESSFQFHMTPSGGVPHGNIDLKSLFVHELGHALGLDHNDLAGSIMNTHLRDGHSRTDLSSDDLSNLLCEYGFGG